MDVKPTSNQFNNPPPVQVHSEVAKAGDGGAGFRQFIGGAVQVAGQLVGNVAGAGGLGMGPLGGGLNAITGGPPGTGGSDFAQLLQLQERMQRESAQFNTLSNVSKTEHETRMAAIRNMKA